MRLEVKPELLKWAFQRAGGREDELRQRFPKVETWIEGKAKPTLKQLETFAKAAHVSVGYLFLSSPPVEKLPINDLRTMGNKLLRHPSPDLLDVIYLCQRRQEWYREYAQLVHAERCDYVGSVTLKTPTDDVAAEMQNTIQFGVAARRTCSTWTDALKLFVERSESIGILVMSSGIVGNNTHRVLDTQEFRGFALADNYAPLVFINSTDSKAAQMFTLAHELAHIWLGESAVSDSSLNTSSSNLTEQWCNQVAAEFLVPHAELHTILDKKDPLSQLGELAREFKVSTLVILRRLLDKKHISRDKFQKAYGLELNRMTEKQPAGGGDFYRTLPNRVSKRFARAIVASALEGQTLFRDAYQMLGISKEETFRELSKKLGYSR